MSPIVAPDVRRSSLGYSGGGGQLKRFIGEAQTADAATWIDVTWTEGSTINVGTSSGKSYLLRAEVTAYGDAGGGLSGYAATQYCVARNVSGTLTVVAQTTYLPQATIGFGGLAPSIQFVVNGSNLNLQVRGNVAATIAYSATIDPFLDC